MKKPKIPEGITVSWTSPGGIYPPLGFFPITEHQLGNGDTYGLYFRMFKEGEAPLVCETWHDSWFINPRFSSMETFLNASNQCHDEDDYLECPSLKDDSNSPEALLASVKTRLDSGDLKLAKEALNTTLAFFPEFTNAWNIAFSLYSRERDHGSMLNAARQSILSSGPFGSASPHIEKWFRQLPDDKLGDFQNDPLFVRRKEFGFINGGVKENEDYGLFLRTIKDYINIGEYKAALLLHRRYGFYMSGETVSFRERSSFSESEFILLHGDYMHRLLGASRHPEPKQ